LPTIVSSVADLGQQRAIHDIYGSNSVKNHN